MAAILVVEDEAVVAMDIERRLRTAGYEVCGTVSTGEKAMRYVVERHPDLVLMDIHIKGDIDGIETAQRLRDLADVPVVYLTAYADRETLLRAKVSEPYGYVVKPFEDRELQAAIETGLYRHEVTLQLKQANAQLQHEILERRRVEEQLLHDAFHDALTGLPNRALFLDRLSMAIERAKRHDDYLFAVLFLDMDRFKGVNDKLGHTQGDQLLVMSSERFRATLRGVDTVARFGGDEFAFLLDDLGQREDAYLAAERIHDKLREPFSLGDQQVCASASIGIVVGCKDTLYERADEVLRDADVAMYRAKSLGRARSQVFEASLRTEVLARLQLESDLANALNRREFRVHYQPIVTLQSGQIAGFEALLRWQHPRLGLLAPSDFISVAEDQGTIFAIGDFVLREACRQIREWQEEYPFDPPLFVSVNVSPAQFGADLPERVARALVEHGLGGASLRLEITETMVMANLEASAALLRRLKALGVQIDVDDFGTGYSCLAYLERLPVDSLKIDRFFVNRIEAGDSCEIVRAIIGLAHKLSMEVVGEGIETAAQLAKLKGLECEFGQGFLLSRPLDATQAYAWLAQQKPIALSAGAR